MKKPRNLKESVRLQMLLEDKTSKWGLYSLGNCPESSMDFIRLYKSLTQKNPVDTENRGQSAAEWYFHAGTSVPVQEIKLPVPKAWRDIIREPIIPYDPCERRKKLAHAFEILAPYIEAHEEFLRQQQKEKKKK